MESRVLATLLTEMDGITGGGDTQRQLDRDHVIVMAATNRIDCIDSALKRKGRFQELIHVPPPNENERIQLLHYFAKKYSLSSEVIDLMRHGQQFNKENISGADVENICLQEAMKIVTSNFV